jgi:PhnB protein
MAVGAYINFNGNCREAVEFYAEVFGGETPKIMTFGDMPEDPECPITDEMKKLVAHTQLNINGSNIMFSDVPPGINFVVGNNISLIVGLNSIDEIKTYFDKLREGGKVEMELQETFWSKYYGFLTDKFGVGWQFNYNS